MFAHVGLAVHLQRIGYPVRSNGPDQQQLLEIGDRLAPLSGEIGPLRAIIQAPILPVVAVFFHVLGQWGEILDMGKTIQRAPLGLRHPPRKIVGYRWWRGILTTFTKQLVFRIIDLLGPQLDSEGQVGEENQFIAVEQAAPCEVVNGIGAGLLQSL